MIDFARELRRYPEVIKVGYDRRCKWVDFWTFANNCPTNVFHLRTQAQSYWNQL